VRTPPTNAADALPLEVVDPTLPKGAYVPTGDVPPATTASPHFLAQATSTNVAAKGTKVPTGDVPPATTATHFLAQATSISVVNATTATPVAMPTRTPSCQDQVPSGSPTPDDLGGTPTRHSYPTPWSTSSWFPPGNCMQIVTPGDACSLHNQHPPGYHSHSPPLDAAATESSGGHKLGGPIVSPCTSNRKRLARLLKTIRYNVATLATLKYHSGETGIQVLTEHYIHECGYTSLLPESPEDILICYWDIIMIHRKVVDGWVNPCSG
jgi:hypothetical protein